MTEPTQPAEEKEEKWNKSCCCCHHFLLLSYFNGHGRKQSPSFGWEAWKFKTNMKQIPENHCRFFRTVCKVMLRAATNEKRTFNVFAIQYTHTHTHTVTLWIVNLFKQIRRNQNMHRKARNYAKGKGEQFAGTKQIRPSGGTGHGVEGERRKVFRSRGLPAGGSKQTGNYCFALLPPDKMLRSTREAYSPLFGRISPPLQWDHLWLRFSELCLCPYCQMDCALLLAPGAH